RKEQKRNNKETKKKDIPSNRRAEMPKNRDLRTEKRHTFEPKSSLTTFYLQWVNPDGEVELYPSKEFIPGDKGRIMEAGYAHSESAVLLCNTWDLVVSEGSGDVSLGHRQLGANG
ncbi:20726_t:CDS:2, partial [Rhizophagus irregularis]